MAPQIIFKQVSYRYSKNVKDLALSNVSFNIIPGSFTFVVGQTGSGKSTLIQQINGLLRPSSGSVRVGSTQVSHKMSSASIMKLRRQVGLVFQLPQDQLFGETVGEDLAFGPKNFGFNKEHVHRAVKTSARLLHLNRLLNSSPFDLSGGQMKRAAIAGVLACHPKVLILDEPTVGLDVYGENHLMNTIEHLRTQLHLTVIMVTHRMNIVAKYATQILILKRGKLVADVNPRQLFNNETLLKESGLARPFAPDMANQLNKQGVKLDRLPLTTQELADEIVEKLKTGRYRE